MTKHYIENVLRFGTVASGRSPHILLYILCQRKTKKCVDRTHFEGMTGFTMRKNFTRMTGGPT